MPAGVLALGVASAVWLAIAGRSEVAGQIPVGNAAGAATVLGLVLAGLVAVVVWLAQQSDQRRRVAEAEAARRAEAEAQARDGENRLFQFLDAIPAGVFVASPGGRPYYANRESERVLGRGVVRIPAGAGWPKRTVSSWPARTGSTPPRACRSSVRCAASPRTLTTRRSTSRMVP